MESTKNKLSRRQYIILGSMLFGLFFGAGNLIFPIHLGQISGSNWLPAAIGFLLSAVCLPLLSILAISMTRSDSMYHLARPVGKGFALFFLICTHASLGLLIASPRTATVSFEIGIKPFIASGMQHTALIIYSLIFFTITYFLSRNQSKMTSYVGKILNPFLILLLVAVFATAFIIKGDGATLGTIGKMNAGGSNMINGFLQGYNTMDALAGLGFGVTIVTALSFFGITGTNERSKSVAKIGSISMGLEAIIYALLIALGAISTTFTKTTANGGPAFSAIMNHYTGIIGTSMLAAMAILACLTTSIGLVTSFSQDLGKRFPKIGFKRFLPFTCIGGFLISNFGLNEIIALSTPILMLLYPLAIGLILLGVMHPFIGKSPIIYKATIGLTLIPAILDAIHALPPFFANMDLFKAIDSFSTSYIPWFSIGMDFVPFLLIGFIAGLIINKFAKQPMRSTSASEID